MKILNYSDFRTNLSDSLNLVNEDREIIVVSRPKGKNVVVMDLDDYNSFQETIHLTSTKANRSRLNSAIEEMERGHHSRKTLLGE